MPASKSRQTDTLADGEAGIQRQNEKERETKTDAETDGLTDKSARDKKKEMQADRQRQRVSGYLVKQIFRGESLTRET